MSTMDLEDDLKQLVSDFASIACSYRKAQEESNSLKDSLKEAVVNVLAIQERVEVLERDYEENQNMIQTATEQLSVIPEYRNNIAQLTESHCDLEKIVREKNKEISRLNNKHVENMKLLEEKIERERREDREGHDTRIEEMRDFLKQAHEAEIISLTKHKEREKRGLVEQLESVQEMLLKVQLEHEQEIEEMKVKLAAANPSQTGNSSASVKIFKEKLLQMQQHYERQIQDLLSSCDAVQTKGILISNQDSYPSQEPQFKKKKVCFNLNPVVNDEGNNIAITKSDKSDDKSGIQPEVFQSLFQEAKDKFCNSTVTNTVSSLREPCVSLSNTVSTVSESHRSAPTTVSLMGEPLLSFTKTSSTVSESHYSAPKIVSSKGDPNYSPTKTVSSVRGPCHSSTKCASSIGDSSDSTSRSVSGYSFKFTSRPISKGQSYQTDFCNISMEDNKSPAGAVKIHDIPPSHYDTVVDVGHSGDCGEWNDEVCEASKESITPAITKKKLFTPYTGSHLLR